MIQSKSIATTLLLLVVVFAPMLCQCAGTDTTSSERTGQSKMDEDPWPEDPQYENDDMWRGE